MPARATVPAMSASSSSCDHQDRSPEDVLTNALALFKLTLPLHPATLHQRYRELLTTWHPHRYASLTHNPANYMQMYKKGETMTKAVEAAYTVLKEQLEKHGHTSSPV